MGWWSTNRRCGWRTATASTSARGPWSTDMTKACGTTPPARAARAPGTRTTPERRPTRRPTDTDQARSKGTRAWRPRTPARRQHRAPERPLEPAHPAAVPAGNTLHAGDGAHARGVRLLG